MLVAVGGFSAFGQGWMTFDGAVGRVYDEFTTAGVGIRAPSDVNVAFLWAATGTADPLTLVNGTGGPSSDGQGRGGNATPTLQVATNGVASVASQWGTITSMLSSGWSWGKDQNAGNVIAIANGTSGAYVYGSNPLELLGSTAGASYEIIAVAWDAASGATVPVSSLAMGWSNPFVYITGTSAGDPVATTFFSQSGVNQFGVASVPEPTTLAFGALGGLSLLLMRRKKS